MINLGKRDRSTIRRITQKTAMPFPFGRAWSSRSESSTDDDYGNRHYTEDDKAALRETSFYAGMHACSERHLSHRESQNFG